MTLSSKLVGLQSLPKEMGRRKRPVDNADEMATVFAKLYGSGEVQGMLQSASDHAAKEAEALAKKQRIEEAQQRPNPPMPPDAVRIEDATAGLDVQAEITRFAGLRDSFSEMLLQRLVENMATLSAIDVAAESIGRITNMPSSVVDTSALRSMCFNLFALSVMRDLGEKIGVDTHTLKFSLEAMATKAFAPTTKSVAPLTMKDLEKAISGATKSLAEPTEEEKRRPRQNPSGPLGSLLSNTPTGGPFGSF